MTYTVGFPVLEAEPRYIDKKTRFAFLKPGATREFSDFSQAPPVPDGTTRNVTQLNVQFWQLVASNYDAWIKYKRECATRGMFQRLSNRKKTISCEKFRDAESSYEDVFDRDMAAFYQEKKQGDVPINVCILFSDEWVYIGHIYVWHVKRVCIGFGIRASPHSFFSPKNISVARYLLEGLRKYAFANECQNLFIPSPLPKMREVLLANRFVENRLYEHIVRNQFMGYDPIISIRDLERGHMHLSVDGLVLKNLVPSFLTAREESNYGFSLVELHPNQGNDRIGSLSGGGKQRHKKCSTKVC